MPENGGWSQDVIYGAVNEPMRLRLISDDVVHGFAVGQSDHREVEIYPGKISEVELLFDHPGEYTFYCTRWCGANHWRMRGTIVIAGKESQLQPTVEPPAYLRLQLNLDAPHLAEILPGERPDAARIAAQAAQVWGNPSLEPIWSTSPEGLWKEARANQTLDKFTDQQIWDMIAWGLSLQASPQSVAQGEVLYRQNCLACHGESGRGDGVMVRDLPPLDYKEMGSEAARPPDFSDPAVLLGASPALLEGKILRGGMGTGMPYWGNIFTGEQIQNLVLYLYTFQMDLEAIR
jgi:mono/diheme cytochrome c family protein